MITKIFHPNVSSSGEICVNTLKKDWQPKFGIQHILVTIKCLLIYPNPESALDEEAGRELLENYDSYCSRAKLITSVHATPKVCFLKLLLHTVHLRTSYRHLLPSLTHLLPNQPKNLPPRKPNLSQRPLLRNLRPPSRPLHLQKTILPTWRSRHTQFLIFHFAQTNSKRAADFISTCLSILENNSRNTPQRVAAAAYVASFVARAKHLPQELVQDTFSRLAQLLQRLQNKYDTDTRTTKSADTFRGPDLRRYTPFYAAFQALMYTFCFRWQAVLANGSGKLTDDAKVET